MQIDCVKLSQVWAEIRGEILSAVNWPCRRGTGWPFAYIHIMRGEWCANAPADGRHNAIIPVGRKIKGSGFRLAIATSKHPAIHYSDSSVINAPNHQPPFPKLTSWVFGRPSTCKFIWPSLRHTLPKYSHFLFVLLLLSYTLLHGYYISLMYPSIKIY